MRNDNLFLCSIIKLGYTNILAWKTREYAMIDRWEYPYHYKAMFQTNQAKDIKYIFSMKYFPNKLWPLRNKNHVKYLKLDD